MYEKAISYTRYRLYIAGKRVDIKRCVPISILSELYTSRTLIVYKVLAGLLIAARRLLADNTTLVESRANAPTKANIEVAVESLSARIQFA